jgi:hypothetical protein
VETYTLILTTMLFLKTSSRRIAQAGAVTGLVYVAYRKK